MLTSQTLKTRTSPAWLLVYLSALLQGLAFWSVPLFDPDLGWHMLGGAWVDKFADVPRADFLNAFNPAWIDYHWFGQWLIFLCYKYLGWPGVQAFCGVISALLGVLLVSIARTTAPRASPLVVLAYVTFILWALEGLISSRPTSLAFVGNILGLLLLLKIGRRAFPAILVLALLCANIHVYWVVFCGLWGLFICAPRFLPASWSRGIPIASPWQAWGGALALAAAGFFSPYGVFSSTPGLEAKFLNYFVLLDVTTNPLQLKDAIGELQSGFSAQPSFLWITIALLTFITLSYSRRRLVARWPYVLLFFGTLLMGAESVKYVPFFLVGTIPLVLPALTALIRKVWILRLLERTLRIACLIVPLCNGFWAYRSLPFSSQNAQLALSALQREQPLEACAEAVHRFGGGNKHLLVGTIYDRGGWCAWAMKHNRLRSNYWVTMDGRTQFIPPRDIIDGITMFYGRAGWEATLARWQPDVLVVQQGLPLAQLLRSSPAWRLVYTDQSFGLFAHVEAAQSSSSK